MLALTGCVLGLTFDLYRAAGRGWRLRGAPAAVFDALYGLFAAALGGLGLLAANWGELRLFALLAMAAGVVGYLWLASPVVLPGATWCADRIRRLAVAVARFVYRPVARLARAVRRTWPRCRDAARRWRDAVRGAVAARRRPPSEDNAIPPPPSAAPLGRKPPPPPRAGTRQRRSTGRPSPRRPPWRIRTRRRARR